MSDVVTVRLQRLGTGHDPLDIGCLLQGSDIPQDKLCRRRGLVVHRRGGVPVAVRTDPVVGRSWRCMFQHSLTVLEQLRSYWLDGACYFYPDGEGTHDKPMVVWDAESFEPVYTHNDGIVEIYTLSVTFEEVVAP